MQTLKGHHIIEFISIPELAELLLAVNAGCYLTSIGAGYVSMRAQSHSIFITAKDGSCKNNWSDENCSDHLSFHVYINGSKKMDYEISLLHTRFTTHGLKEHLLNYLFTVTAAVKHELIRSESALHNRNPLQIPENIAIMSHSLTTGALR